VVVAAAGPARRELARTVPERFRLPDGYEKCAVAIPGVLAVEGPAFQRVDGGEGEGEGEGHSVAREMETFAASLDAGCDLDGLPLIVLVDDAEFAAKTLRNFLWVTFTRSNPSHDIHGVGSFIEHKHWGCRKSLIIDARLKPHHAPPLIEDPGVTRRVDALAAPGGSLHGVL